MAQDITWTGAVLTEADIIAKLMHEDGVWTGWTPTLTQSATPTKTVNYSRWARASRLINASCHLAVTSAGTAANTVLIGLPVAASAAMVANTPIGTFYVYDASATTLYHGICMINSSTTVFGWASGFAGGLGGFGFSAALASSDLVGYSIAYEAAS